MFVFIVVAEFEGDPFSQFPYLSKCFKTAIDGSIIHIEVDSQHLSCQAFFSFHGYQKFLVVEIIRPPTSWLIFQASFSRFETGKPLPVSTFADFVLIEKFVEIAK
ncbi:hypothetical protein TNCV_284911 [Trichonephila clavipes]|uniref:Uncharacterized protein n=1 Tax=Trichonephila clavipes TaxID=2585209 RepID=A0A8X6SJ48_TRICX|nr:hypothetical protein TNCV_284911 [Trichonephila clavipes]